RSSRSTPTPRLRSSTSRTTAPSPTCSTSPKSSRSCIDRHALDVRGTLPVGARPLVPADRRLDSGLLRRCRAPRGEVPERTSRAAGLARPPRLEGRPRRLLTLVDQAARPTRGRRPPADLLRLRRPLHRNGDPRLPGGLRDADPALDVLRELVLPDLLPV